MDKIKLDVIGHGDLTSQPWEDGWDTIHGLAAAVREGVLDPDSRVEGELRVSVASKSEVRNVNERFRSVVKVDETLFQCTDKTFCKVVATKGNSGNLLTQAQADALTSIGTWFQNNTELTDARDLSGFKNLKTLSQNAFSGCSNLKYIDLSNIETFAGGALSGLPSLDIVLYLKNAKRLKSYNLNGRSGRAKIVFLPNVEYIGGQMFRNNNNTLIDIGTKCKTIEGYLNEGGTNMVSRSVTPPSFTRYIYDRFSKYFVPASALSEYKADSGWSWNDSETSKFFAIGSEQWQTAMRTLATTYAKEYAGWTDEQIATADYSDPYIDYRIFGLEPPTD